MHTISLLFSNIIFTLYLIINRILVTLSLLKLLERYNDKIFKLNIKSTKTSFGNRLHDHRNPSLQVL